MTGTFGPGVHPRPSEPGTSQSAGRSQSALSQLAARILAAPHSKAPVQTENTSLPAVK
jgi:hypothetical protein